MASPESFHKCDYLHLHTDSHVFKSNRAGLVHVEEQISLLDHHISRDLQHRSHQLHNLPIEVLSYIFQHVLETERHSPDPNFDFYRLCLRQALALSSVSAHFRQAALYTPDLWKRVPMHITGESFEGAVSLLQHCSALSPYIGISVREALYEGSPQATAIDTLLTPDVNQKIKAFELSYSRTGSDTDFWMKKLRTSSFPVLDSISVWYEHWNTEESDAGGLHFDLGTLNSVTRFSLYGPHLDPPVILPSSVQILHLYNVPQEVVIRLLYQCSNLVECIAYPEICYNDDFRFLQPLTLNHLKRLTWRTDNGLEITASVKKLQLPSLEYLTIHHWVEEPYSGINLLCRNVSATLTTLVISIFSDENYSEDDDFGQFVLPSLPKLEKLECYNRCNVIRPLMRFIFALTKEYGERNIAWLPRLPCLRSLILGSNSGINPMVLLVFLRCWRVEEVSYVHVAVKSEIRGRLAVEDWSPELKELLRSVVGNRQIEVTWDGQNILTVNAQEG